MSSVDDRPPPSADPRTSRIVARVSAGVCGTAMSAFGVWALLWPASFARMIDFPPYNEHLLHDAGAFQLGIGAGLLLALVVSDALTVALTGFVVAGTLHSVNHGTDLHLGGHHSDPWALGALVLVAAFGLVAQLRRPSIGTGRPASTRHPSRP